MKKLCLILISLFSGLTYGQNGFELAEIEFTRAGSTETIKKQIQPKEQPKLLAYDSLNMFYTGGWSFGQSFSIWSHATEFVKWLFIGSGAGVMIFDASDPYNLVKLSEIHARGLVDAIYYRDQTLYLAAYFSGLEVWDLSDMQNPVRLSRIPTTGLPRGGVYVPQPDNSPGSNPHAYLVNVVDGIDVFEINMGQPTFVTNQNFTGSLLIWNSYGYGDLLFLAAGNGATKAIDLTLPILENPFNVPGTSTSVAAKDNKLYIVNSSQGMKIYDFSQTPATQLGEVTLQGFPYRISLDTDVAYIANSTTNPGGGINVVDIADPSAPEELGTYPGYQNYVTGMEDRVFSTGGQEGCLALDASDPENPVFASNVELPVSTIDIAVKNDYAFIGNNGFRVFDISDKSNPVQVGFDDTEGALVKVFSNHAVYCPESMGSSNRINIMDVSDPANPQKMAHITAPYMTNDLDLKAYTAYVACWWDGIRVVDYSDPESPSWGSHVMGWVSGATPGEEWLYCQALDVSGDYLYAIDYGPFQDEDTKGLYVFDISDPLSPQLLKRYADYTGTGWDIEVSNGYAYIADNAGGMSIVSVLDPLDPEEVAYLPLGDAAWAVDVFGQYAFIANYILEGVQVVDISDPANPSIAGYYKRSGCFALNVTYHAGHVFVADGPAGMQIYNFDQLNDASSIKTTNNTLRVYPNPATNKIFIEGFQSARNAQISVYNLYGQIAFQSMNLALTKESGTSIDLANFRKGVYILSVTFENKIHQEKIVVQ